MGPMDRATFFSRAMFSCAILSWGIVAASCSGAGETEGSDRAAGASGSATPVVPRGGGIGVTDEGETIVFAPERRPAASGAAGATKVRPELLVREPSEPDPLAAPLTLEQAVEGLPVDGQLVAEINTDLGSVFCDLHADRAPIAVANFIGLARGLRPWWDATAATWRRGQPYFRDTTFHRVIPEYLIQGGDYLGDGSGTIGYTIPLERHETLSHDQAGRLAMATSGGNPNSGGAQFYITDGPAPALDGTATVFGTCRPEHVISEIARVPQDGAPNNRPLTAVRIARVLIRRVEGGAQAATVTAPRLPAGEPEVPRAASPGPSELRQLDGMRQRREQAEQALREQAARDLPR
jgi:peptidyl-prolyl cis-trans isomerase A (cyclophilin A)